MNTFSSSGPTEDAYAGCLLGLASGDALGAPYEGGLIERLLWALIGRTREGARRWTDDTQMALDLAESLLDKGSLDQDDLARRFAGSYRWRRGYGPAAARLLKRVCGGEHWSLAAKAVYPTGSFGNGAAMRAPVLALFFTDLPAPVEAARQSAVVTHAHPLGVEGAVLIAVAAHRMLYFSGVSAVLSSVEAHCQSGEFRRRLTMAAQWLDEDAQPAPALVAKTLGNGITAHASCISALYIALRHLEDSFENMMAFIIAVGGDVDTIGAIAGALWGAKNGAAALPVFPLEERCRLETVSKMAALAILG